MGKVIIGVCGVKYSGKDEVAKAICTKLRFTRTAFADLLKEACGLTFNMNVRQLHGDQKEVPFKIRGLTNRSGVLFGARSSAIRVYGLDRLLRLDAMDVPMLEWGGLTPNIIIERMQQGCLELYDANRDFTPREVMQHVGTDVCRKRIHDETWIKSTIAYIKKSDLDLWVIPDARFPNEIAAIRKAGGYLVRVDRPSLGEQSDHHESEVAWQKIQPDECVLNVAGLAELHELAISVVSDIIDRQATDGSE